MKKNYNNLQKLRICKILIVGCLLFVVGFATTTRAQITSAASSISIELSPESPKPFENVKLKLVTFSIDIDRVSVSWYVNNKLILSGTGKTKFSFNVGDIGSVFNVNAVIIGNGVAVNKSISIAPTEVDVLWESTDSYTHPFYKGKALASSQSSIKLTAIPHIVDKNGKNLQANNMVYKWKKNYKFRDFNDQSGYGKQSVIFRRDMLRQTETIEVTVSSFNRNISAKNKFVLGRFSPKIVFYQKHPLEGILYNKAIKNDFILDERETTIVAEPYFFSPKNKDTALLSYVWRLGNKKVDDTESDNKNEIVLRREEGGGTSKISLNVRNVARLLQFVGNSFNVSF